MNQATQFNPFEDRLSRDIRNDLSESIIEVLTEKSLLPAEQVASKYRRQNPAACYSEYIDQRLDRYGRALALMPAGSGLLHRAAVLWDLKLFFEVHEILEPSWIKAKGDEKRLLQALIRSAGVYINLELNYRQRARKIADKAVPVLKELGTALEGIIDTDNLIAALETLDKDPPRLRWV